MEINGVNAEPTHIYQPGHGLFKAYRDIFSHMKIIYEIGKTEPLFGHKAQKIENLFN